MNLKQILKNISVIDRIYVQWKWREKRTTYGNQNEDKIFFIIRRAKCKVGLFSLVMTNMGLVKYALDKGYIPVIDMQSSQNTYLEEDQVGKANSWEFYFEQPCGYSLEDIRNSKNIILSSGLIGKKNFFPDHEMIRNPAEYKMWRKLFAEHFHIKGSIIKEMEQIKRELFRGKRVVGVLCRGTDYVNTRPKNHPIQPAPKEMFMKVHQVLDEKQCDLVYLTTEDERIFKEFREEFGVKLISLDTKRYCDTGDKNINDIFVSSGKSRYLLGKEYLLSILLLSECNCLVAGSAGGTYGALLIGKEYEYQYVFEMGTY